MEDSHEIARFEGATFPHVRGWPNRSGIRRDAGMIVIVCLTAIQSIGTNANATFNNVAGKLGS